MKYYVVSDVHGFYTQTVQALTDKGFFDDKDEHKLIVCGDMMDRGGEALKMQEFMLDLAERDQLIFIKGNHEELMLLMLDEMEVAFKEGRPGIKQRHVHNGTIDTAMQLAGYSTLVKALRNTPDVIEKVKSSVYYSKLIPGSIDYLETKNYIFVHGWIPCKETIGVDTYFEYDPDWRSATSEQWFKARWKNGMKLAEEWGITEPGKTIVCGHYHTSFGHSVYRNRGSEYMDDAVFEPYVSEGIIAIDACTAHSGLVNCIVIEDEE